LRHEGMDARDRAMPPKVVKDRAIAEAKLLHDLRCFAHIIGKDLGSIRSIMANQNFISLKRYELNRDNCL
jgi:hypothetical protein